MFVLRFSFKNTNPADHIVAATKKAAQYAPHLKNKNGRRSRKKTEIEYKKSVCQSFLISPHPANVPAPRERKAIAQAAGKIMLSAEKGGRRMER